MNRFEGVHPDFTGYDLVLTPKEKRYLKSLADSKSVLDRRLCLEHLDNHDEVKSNARFVLRILDQLIPDRIDMISGQALLQLEMFFSGKDYFLQSVGGGPIDSEYSASRLKVYESWDPVRQSWPIILKYCTCANRDLRSLSAVFLLETLLDFHFAEYFPKVKSIIDRGNKRLLDAMSCCFWPISISPEDLTKVNDLYTIHLKGDRLESWRWYYRVLTGEIERRPSKPRSDRPKGCKNRLLNSDLLQSGCIVRLKQEEKDYLSELFKSGQTWKRIRCLEVFEKWRIVKANKGFFSSMMDRGLGDRNVQVRSLAAILLQEQGKYDPNSTFKLILKHGSSNSPDTQRMIAIGPLRDFVEWNKVENLEEVCNAVERENEHFARTVSQMLLWNMEADWFDRFDSVLAKKLNPRELSQWRKRCRLFREGMKR